MSRSRLDGSSLLSPSPATNKPRTRCRFLPATLAALSVALSLHLFFSRRLPSPTASLNYGALFLSLGSNATAAAHLRALTLHPHVAGTAANAAAARYVLDAFSSLSFPAHITPYSVLLSYPIHRSLSLSSPGRGEGVAATTTSFSLTQKPARGDPDGPTAVAEAIPTFYAYAASGSVSAEAVYANYGREEDFALLAARGVDVKGKVALARYGTIHCEDIARFARDAGAAAVVVYTDPLQYGGGDGSSFFPDARWLPPSGVQVGSLFRGVGDPTTPMWASSEGCERVAVEDAMKTDDMPLIPGLPVSARDAMEVHRAMGGDVAPDDWQGRPGGPVYRLGPGPAVLNLTYIGNDTMATIENVFAMIEGAEEPDRYVILGNHRDAWTFGAADPNSGTASMIELAERFSMLQKQGWRPRRTIIFCSWDAEEYGLTGSTEWVEENRDILSSRAVAYLNIDVSVVGPVFRPSATPQLDELFQETIKLVQDPDNSSQTVYDSWVKSNISPMVSCNMNCLSSIFYCRFIDKLLTLELQRKLLSKKLNKDSLKIRELNDRLMQAERAFTSREGLVSDKWSKHLVFGTSEQNDWDTAAYPGIADAIAEARRSNTSESWKLVQHEIYRVARAVTQAATVLSGSLT
ncbi:hypothetical protein PR202_gb04820 [Eleusine coracana subsp. coracana]|uniref:Aminopeptidase NAALADL1 n=1 Tax=Eleusine coracana subsp. coracana TaxID=191504 RepID=A0AAV5E5I8_ELECO|nr:hypothetical protein PR202_gb04820 [Eleusine coracana subsp. coracana]